jgi:DNA-binding transcriptional regulator YhcF (GntR family)
MMSAGTPDRAAISLVPDSSVPPFEQIRSQLHDLIRSGGLAAGQRLPSIRQLAGDLRVAPGTVARAFAELEASGLLETSRTRGTRVRPEQVADDQVRQAARRFVEAARSSSTDLSDALGLVRAAWNQPG